MYDPRGIKVNIQGEDNPCWFNRVEDPEIYDDLMKIYEVPNANGLPRISHGVCNVHEPYLGTK